MTEELREALIERKVLDMAVLGNFEFEELGWILEASSATTRTAEAQVLLQIELSGLWMKSSQAVSNDLKAIRLGAVVLDRPPAERTA